MDSLPKSEAAHIAPKQRKKAKKRLAEGYNEEQDDMFYYIAGYTSGGAAYGVTWEEIGIEPFENEDEECL